MSNLQRRKSRESQKGACGAGGRETGPPFSEKPGRDCHRKEELWKWTKKQEQWGELMA